MSQFVAALPGWCVLSIVNGVESKRDPIVAWKIEDSGGPVPITLARLQTPLDNNHVIVTPDGNVVDNGEMPGNGDDGVDAYIQRVQESDDKRHQQARDRKAKAAI